jgi:hypothetical protein
LWTQEEADSGGVAKSVEMINSSRAGNYLLISLLTSHSDWSDLRRSR